MTEHIIVADEEFYAHDYDAASGKEEYADAGDVSRHERCDRQGTIQSRDPLSHCDRSFGGVHGGQRYLGFSAGRDRKGRRGPRPRNAVIFLQSLVNNRKPIIAAVDGIAIGIGTTMVFHCDYVVASTTATFSSPFIQYGLVPEGASSLLLPRMVGHQRAFAMLVMGRSMSAEDAREAGFVNTVVPPGHADTEARKVAREICELPADAVAISRKLLKLPTEDLVRRIDWKIIFSANGCVRRRRSPRSRISFCARRKDSGRRTSFVGNETENTSQVDKGGRTRGGVLFSK